MSPSAKIGCCGDLGGLIFIFRPWRSGLHHGQVDGYFLLSAPSSERDVG